MTQNQQSNLHITQATISNFRRLQKVVIDFERDSTIFVGANNSGKSSACLALTYLLNGALDALSVYDFSVWSLTRLNQEITKQLGKSEPVSEKELAKFTEKVNGQLPKVEVTLALEQSDEGPLWKCLYDNHIHFIPGTKSECVIEIAIGLARPDDLLTDFQQVRDQINQLASQFGQESAQVNYGIEAFLANRDLSDYFKLEARLVADKHPSVDLANKINLKQLFKVTYISPQRELTSISEHPGSGNYQILNRNFNARMLTSRDPDYAQAYLHQLKLDEFWTARFQEKVHPLLRSLDDKIKGSPDSPRLTVSGKSPSLSAPKMLPVFELGCGSVLANETAATSSGRQLAQSSSYTYQLPERNGGSGVQNLYNIFLQVHQASNQWQQTLAPKRPLIHLVILEEPETNMHTSARCTLVDDLYRVATQSLTNPQSQVEKPASSNQAATASDLSSLYSTQMVLTTHSVDIVEQVYYSQIRYFKRCPEKGVKAPAKFLASTIKNLAEDLTDIPAKTKYAKHLLRKQLDLLFCDAVVAVEGPSELLLLPKMFAELRRQLVQAKHANPDLKVIPGLEEFLHASVGWVMVGGRHFQSFKYFYDALGIPVLCITDVDYTAGVKVEQLKAEPKDLNQLKTSSTILKELLLKHKLIAGKEKPTLEKLAKLFREDKFAFTDNMLITSQTAVDLRQTQYFQRQHQGSSNLNERVVPAWEQKVEIYDWTDGAAQWPVSFESAMVLANVDWFLSAASSSTSESSEDVESAQDQPESTAKQGKAKRAAKNKSDRASDASSSQASANKARRSKAASTKASTNKATTSKSNKDKDAAIPQDAFSPIREKLQQHFDQLLGLSGSSASVAAEHKDVHEPTTGKKGKGKKANAASTANATANTTAKIEKESSHKTSSTEAPATKTKNTKTNSKSNDTKKKSEDPFFLDLHKSFANAFKNEFATHLLYSENFSSLRLPNYILAGAAALGKLLKKD